MSYYLLTDLAIGGSENSTVAMLSQALSSSWYQQSNKFLKYYRYRNRVLPRNSVTDDKIATLKQI